MTKVALDNLALTTKRSYREKQPARQTGLGCKTLRRKFHGQQREGTTSRVRIRRPVRGPLRSWPSLCKAEFYVPKACSRSHYINGDARRHPPPACADGYGGPSGRVQRGLRIFSGLRSLRGTWVGG